MRDFGAQSGRFLHHRHYYHLQMVLQRRTHVWCLCILGIVKFPRVVDRGRVSLQLLRNNAKMPLLHAADCTNVHLHTPIHYCFGKISGESVHHQLWHKPLVSKTARWSDCMLAPSHQRHFSPARNQFVLKQPTWKSVIPRPTSTYCPCSIFHS